MVACRKGPAARVMPSPVRPRPAVCPISPAQICRSRTARGTGGMAAWAQRVPRSPARPLRPAAFGLGVLKSHQRIAEAHLKGRVALATPFPVPPRHVAPATGSALNFHLKTAKERASDWIPVVRSTPAPPAKPAALTGDVPTSRRMCASTTTLACLKAQGALASRSRARTKPAACPI
jgi:hypothetical protein